MRKNTCCICDPTLPINPNVCARHKLEGLRLARARGGYYFEAAGELYLEARHRQTSRQVTITCGNCMKRSGHFVELGDLAVFCTECVAKGAVPWIRPVTFPALGVNSPAK
jgi:hypothetical protein